MCVGSWVHIFLYFLVISNFMNLLLMNSSDKLCWCLSKDFEVLKLRARMADRMHLSYFFTSCNYACFGNSDRSIDPAVSDILPIFWGPFWTKKVWKEKVEGLRPNWIGNSLWALNKLPSLSESQFFSSVNLATLLWGLNECVRE